MLWAVLNSGDDALVWWAHPSNHPPPQIHASREGTPSSIMTSSIMIRFPRTIGHRGARGYAPENTLAGIRTAAEQGVRLGRGGCKAERDGVPILMHDDTVNRTTDGRGAVATMDFADIRRLDAGNPFGPQFAGERIPTLEETLALVFELGLGIESGNQALPRPGGGNRPQNAGYHPLPMARRPPAAPYLQLRTPLP